MAWHIQLLGFTYSGYYELDQLPSIQSSVIQAREQHFGRIGMPHTLITDNGPQFTSELFKGFARKYGFNHITSKLGPNSLTSTYFPVSSCSFEISGTRCAQGAQNVAAKSVFKMAGRFRPPG